MSKGKRFLIISVVVAAALLLVLGAAFAAPGGTVIINPPSPVTKSGLPGETLVYTLRLTNTDTTIGTFQVSATSEKAGWDVTVQPAATFTLAAESSTGIIVSVTIPIGTAYLGTGHIGGITDTIHVSVFDPEVGSTALPGGTATLVAKIKYQLYLPVIRKS